MSTFLYLFVALYFFRLKKKKIKNNFFIKAAEEMDMIIDDDRLYPLHKK